MRSIALVLLLASSALGAQEPWKTEWKDVAIPMRDGKTLAANILLPAKPGRYPCILVQTPYDKNRFGCEFGDKAGSEVARGSQKAWKQFDFENYAYVIVDWRGFHGSKAAALAGAERRKWKRGQDGYDTVEWIAKQPWSDGKVGTWGGSALGKQQFDTAAEQPPHLVCAAPLIAAQGTRYSTYFEGGVMIESIVKTHDHLGFGLGEFVRANRLPNRAWGVVENLTYTPSRITVPCLMISGWWDNYPRDVIQQFQDLREGGAKESRLVMGPWSHTQIDMPEQGDLIFKDSEDYSTKITLKFFDYYLRGIKDSGWDALPRVHAYQAGEGWVTAASWSELAGKSSTLHLHADGGIRPTAPEGAATRAYAYDPKRPSPTIGGQNLPPLTHGPKDVSSLEKRGDVLVYATDALDRPLRMRGDVELTLHVSCDRPDTDLHVRLCDSDPEGRAYLVGETAVRAKLRDGKSAQPLKPGEVVELRLRFPPHAYTWAKGHRLKLIVTGGNAPRYECNTQTGRDDWQPGEAVPATVSLHHGPARGSVLTLPLID